MKVLRIVFCILSCLCVVAAVMLGIFVGMMGCLFAIAGAVMFGAAMMIVIHLSQPKPPPRRDFMDPPDQDEKK